MNELKVTQQKTIVALHERGWSKRKIARELGVDRQTVRRYLAASGSKSPTEPAKQALPQKPQGPTVQNNPD